MSYQWIDKLFNQPRDLNPVRIQFVSMRLVICCGILAVCGLFASIYLLHIVQWSSAATPHGDSVLQLAQQAALIVVAVQVFVAPLYLIIKYYLGKAAFLKKVVDLLPGDDACASDLLSKKLDAKTAELLLCAMRQRMAREEQLSSAIATALQAPRDPASIVDTLQRTFPKYLKEHLIEAFVVGGLLTLIASLLLRLAEKTDFADSFQAIGLAVLVTGVAGAITRSELLLKTFRNALADVIYGEKHLPTRNDLKDIWIRVSLALSKQRFPKIATKVFEEMHALYLENHGPYYRSKFVSTHELDWDPQKPGELISIETTSYTIVANDPNSTVNYRPQVKIPKELTDIGSDKLLEFSINGECNLAQWKELSTICGTDEWKPGSWHVWCNLVLCGKSEYHFVTKHERRFNPQSDNFWKLISTHILEQPEVRVHIRASGLEVAFDPSGTPGEWLSGVTGRPPLHEELRSTVRLDLFYPGVVFPEQGFMLIYRTIPQASSQPQPQALPPATLQTTT